MQIKANGITFNYRIEGPEGAPWLVFTNSLATNLSMWDEQAAALEEIFGSCATTSAVMAARKRPRGATISICWSPT